MCDCEDMLAFTKEYFKFKFFEFDDDGIKYLFSINNKIFSDIIPAEYFPDDSISAINNFRIWLEALSLGVQEASFKYKNVTGGTTYFRFLYNFKHKGFSIRPENVFEIIYNKKKIYSYEIKRKYLINIIYNSIMDFVKSDYHKKNRKKWEGFNIGQLVAYELELDFNYEEFKKKILKMPLDEFKTLYLETAHKALLADVESHETEIVDDYILSQNKMFDEYFDKEYQKSHYLWKLDRVECFFNNLTITLGDTSLFEFKSKIIEDFLDKQFYYECTN